MMPTSKNFLLLCTALFCTIQCLGVQADDPTAVELARLCRGNEYQKIPHPDEEEKYIQCTKTPTVGVCPPTQSGGRSIRTCFDKEEETCADCKDVHNDKPDDRSAFIAQYICQGGNYDTLPGNDCQHFFMCKATAPFYEYRTCKPGFEYSMVEGMCSKDGKCNINKGSGDKPSANNPPETENQDGTQNGVRSLCADNEAGYRYAHEKDCNKYHVCYKAMPYDMTCDSGFNYDDKLKTCVRGPCKQVGKN